jgi:hypothetical protein
LTKEQLWDLIQDQRGWRYLYTYLEVEEAAYLSQLLEVESDAQ